MGHIDPTKTRRDLIQEVTVELESEHQNRARDIGEFCSRLYADAPLDTLTAASSASLARCASSLWSWLQQRPRETPKIRILNPDESALDGKSRTLIEIVVDDAPFLVDSITGVLADLEAEVVLFLHPILNVHRSDNGSCQSLVEPAEGTRETRESVMQIHLRRLAVARHTAVRDALKTTLADVHSAVADWQPMRARCLSLADEIQNHPPPLDESQVTECVEFIRWLADDHFTFLGARQYHFDGSEDDTIGRIVADSGLGILRDDSKSVFDGLRHLGLLPDDTRHFIQQPVLLRVTKANLRTSVHRSTNLDAISIKALDDDGNVVGENLFVGLFTSTVYSESVLDIPLARRKVHWVMNNCGFAHRSHNSRALQHVLETHPRDEIFQISAAELLPIALRVLQIRGTLQTALIARVDPFERFVSCLIFTPRERFSTALRTSFEDILSRAFQGRVTTYYTYMTDEPLARIQVILKTTPGLIPEVDETEIERRLRVAAESWNLKLTRRLVESYGEELGHERGARFANVFSAGYQEYYQPDDGARDVEVIESLLERGDTVHREFRLLAGRDDDERSVILKIFTWDEMTPLWLLLQRLDRMGLRVLVESHFDMELKTDSGGRTLWIREIQARVTGSFAFDLASVRDLCVDALERVWAGTMESDGFNRLVLSARLQPREVALVRAYSRYLNQALVPFSQSYMRSILIGGAEITRRLVDLFLTRFDPGIESDRKQQVEALEREVAERLDAVESLDEDRVFRRFFNLVSSTLRTSYFQRQGDGEPKPYIALKLDSTQLLDLPEPRPWREIWVHSPTMEGIHLRGGPVARGGIRWSDRLEDFRTEILGLMKAQMVKNAVIVPEGSKGGFVVRRISNDPTQSREQVVEAYKLLINGMLDLTDNRDGDATVPPTDVVCWDDPDAYLVVAADKGTATFSDTANEISRAAGFWLDDAFASGGSAGYDHKKMGITAKGAWESVKRHFRELGHDTQSEPFSVVGVGDMSGDVFGNGMLLSTQIKLIGAFNHRHVFVDPSPDPERSFAERQRLFELPRSSWSDYDESLLSPGGAIFDRSAKSVEPSREVRELFDIEEERVTPDQLVAYLIRARTDLLWFGGIGTYIKSRQESHADAGDRANDAVRADAHEVRARVVGEGANLGVTQKGRVACALAGVKLNTDFIDNSAGVDCSDHEVNLKILLGAAEISGEIDRRQRDTILREVEDDVSELVLRDNYLQTQSISVTEALASRLGNRLARTLNKLEAEGKLDRELEFLPSADELEDRRRRDQGFLRPELATLLCYAKMDLFRDLATSPVLDDPALETDLLRYFPTPLRSRFAEGIRAHRLRREIVATSLTNEIVNRVGIPFVDEMTRRTGRSKGDVVLAFVAAREILEVFALWIGIENLDLAVDARTQSQLLADCGRVVERCTLWLLRRSGEALDVGALIESYSGDFSKLRHGLDDLLAENQREAFDHDVRRHLENGVPEITAVRLERTRRLAHALDIFDLARNSNRAPEWVGRLYFECGDRFGFDWLRRAALAADSRGYWDQLAIRSLVDELFQLQAQLTAKVVADDSIGSSSADEEPISRLESWSRDSLEAVTETTRLLSELRSHQSVDVALLTVAIQSLRALTTGRLA